MLRSSLHDDFCAFVGALYTYTASLVWLKVHCDLMAYLHISLLHTQVEYVEGEEDALPLKERSMDCESFFMVDSVFQCELTNAPACFPADRAAICYVDTQCQDLLTCLAMTEHCGMQ